MTVTVPDVLSRLNASADATAEATTALTFAQEAVDAHVAGVLTAYTIAAGTIPASALDEAVLRVACDVFARAHAPNGVLMTAWDDSGNGSSTPIRLARDPLWSARDVLAPWIPEVGGFA